jgi:hypothetical protein
MKNATLWDVTSYSLRRLLASWRNVPAESSGSRQPQLLAACSKRIAGFATILFVLSHGCSIGDFGQI